MLELPARIFDQQSNLESVLDTDSLITRCQQGDAKAFRELFLRHRAEVARLVFRLAGPRVDIEDLVQDIFLQVYRSLKDFRNEAKFSTWLHRVAVNVVLMQRRAARSRPQLVEVQTDDGQVDDRMAPDEDAERRQRIRAFRQLIDGLPEKKRTVFVLHDVEGLLPSDISKIVGAPVLTVRTRLFYARRELAQKMKADPALASFAAVFSRGATAGQPAPAPTGANVDEYLESAESTSRTAKGSAKAFGGAQ